jgi:hypothetical protein
MKLRGWHMTGWDALFLFLFSLFLIGIVRAAT